MQGAELSHRLVPLARIADSRLSPLLAPLVRQEAEASDIEAAFPDFLRRVMDASSAQELRTVGMEPSVFLHAFARLLVHVFGEEDGHPYEVREVGAGTPGGPASTARHAHSGTPEDLEDDRLRARVEAAVAPLLGLARPTGWHVYKTGVDQVCECTALSLNEAAANRPELSAMSAHERLELDILLHELGVPIFEAAG